MSNNRLTITDVARSVGVTPRTIMRWEKAGKIKRPKRDWRGWRIYYKEDIEEIKRFYETCYEYDAHNGAMINISKGVFTVVLAASLAVFGFCSFLYAEAELAQTQAITETASSVDIELDKLPLAGTTSAPITEDVKYTLGPNDVIEIEVRRHPEFSGKYPITSEGKIEYKFVGDVLVSGLTKAELKERLMSILAEFIIEPQVDVQILAYLSKVFYVVGDVANPGKFYMRGNKVTVREALVQAGLPTSAAAMRKCRLITPDNSGKDNYAQLDVYNLLYKGDLKQNLDMQPGDVLYVPPTVMAKIIRVISPVSSVVGQASGVTRNATNIAP